MNESNQRNLASFVEVLLPIRDLYPTTYNNLPVRLFQNGFEMSFKWQEIEFLIKKILQNFKIDSISNFFTKPIQKYLKYQTINTYQKYFKFQMSFMN